ncbi:RtcB family protein [Streptomyces sp. M19]
MRQLHNVATLPWIKGLAVMPDVHYGKGATVGSVIAMHGAVCPRRSASTSAAACPRSGPR